MPLPLSTSTVHPTTHRSTLTEPLLSTASTSASEAPVEHPPVATAEETATALAATRARLAQGGAAMRRLLHTATNGLTAGASAVSNVSAAGYNNIVKPAGSAVLHASLTTVKGLAEFLQETSLSGVKTPHGEVSGLKDSVLKFPQAMIPRSIKDLFTPDERGLSEKGLEFLKHAGTYAGGMTASLIHQMTIVIVADTIGRISAQATSDELEEANFMVPLAVTGALTLLATGQATLFRKNMDLSDLSPEQKSTVIASHFGLTQENFDARPEDEKAVLESKTKRDWLIMAGAGALMPAAGFGMNLIASLSSTAFTNSVFMDIAKTITKDVIRIAAYGGLREALQESSAGPNGGSADLTHSEAHWAALKYLGIEIAVDRGQNAALQALSTHPAAARADALIQATPLASTWGETASILMAYSVVNSIGEALNLADDSLDRARKDVKIGELAQQDLIKSHKEAGMEPPTPEQLKSVEKQAEFSFNLIVKNPMNRETLANFQRRAGGSLLAREGLFAYITAVSYGVSQFVSGVKDKIGDSNADMLSTVLSSASVALFYTKFTACAQSLGTLKAIRAKNEREALPTTSSVVIEELDPASESASAMNENEALPTTSSIVIEELDSASESASEQSASDTDTNIEHGSIHSQENISSENDDDQPKMSTSNSSESIKSS